MQTTLKKVIVVLFGNEISPRFDLATEVMIVSIAANGAMEEEKTLVLPHPSPDKLCHMVLAEDAHTLICGGIEEEHYQYLIWKRINVIDSVIGNGNDALDRFAKGELNPGDILFDLEG